MQNVEYVWLKPLHLFAWQHLPKLTSAMPMLFPAPGSRVGVAESVAGRAGRCGTGIKHRRFGGPFWLGIPKSPVSIPTGLFLRSDLDDLGVIDYPHCRNPWGRTSGITRRDDSVFVLTRRHIIIMSSLWTVSNHSNLQWSKGRTNSRN